MVNLIWILSGHKTFELTSVNGFKNTKCYPAVTAKSITSRWNFFRDFFLHWVLPLRLHLSHPNIWPLELFGQEALMFELVCQLVSDQNGCLLLETRLMASETKKLWAIKSKQADRAGSVKLKGTAALLISFCAHHQYKWTFHITRSQLMKVKHSVLEKSNCSLLVEQVTWKLKSISHK